MKQVLALCFTLCAYVAAVPPDVYSDSHLVDLLEVDLEKRTVDSRKFKVHLFGKDVELNLQRSKGFLPDTLPVHFLDVDENGNRIVRDFTHRTGGAQDLFYDPVTSASIMLDELDGRTKVEGSIMGEYIIEPLEGNASPDHLMVPGSDKVKHRVYKTNVTSLPVATPDFIPMGFKSGNVSEPIEKRQSVSRIYPHIHVVVDYSHYKQLARSEKEVKDYVAIIMHTVQVSHFATMTNPTCQSSLQGITVCTSDAACAHLNTAKWTYNEYKYPTPSVATFAYQERGRTGTDYDLLIVLTKNQICAKSGDCGVGGWGNMPGCCHKFDDYYKLTHRVGMMQDSGAFDGVRGIGHEVGHMLNMPHDVDTNCGDSGDYIMGQTKTAPNNWRYSACSMWYLHQYLAKSDSNCLKTPPNTGSLFGGWPSDAIGGRYISLDAQCKAIYGSQHKSCQNSYKEDSSICYKLKCGWSTGGSCWEYQHAAAEGSTCGPGKWCAKGYCVNYTPQQWPGGK